MKVFKYIFKQKLLITFTIILLLIESLCMFATPYVSSIVIDYGIQQNGIMFAVPLNIDPYSYRYVLRMADDDKKDLIEKSFSKVYNDKELYPGDKEKFYYEINTFGYINLFILESIFTPIMAHGVEDPEFIHKIDTYGASDISNISEDYINNEKQSIVEYKKDHDFSYMYQKSISEKIAENDYMGIDNYWYQINFTVAVSVAMIVIVLIYLIVTIIGTYLCAKISYNISKKLRKKQFEKVMSFSSHDMDKFSRASLITRATNDLQVVQNTSVFIIRAMLIAPVIMIIGLIMALLTAPSFIWILGLAIVILFVIAIILVLIVMPKYKLIQKLIDKINKIARESISGVSIIRALNNEDFQEKRFDVANKDLYSTTTFAMSVLIVAMPILMLTINLLSIVILWVGGYYLQAGEVNIGQLIAFISYSTETIFAFLAIAAGFVMLPRADVSIGRIEEVLKHKLKINNFNTETKISKNTVDINEYIKFENVCFKYDESKKNFFDNLNLALKKNSINAIVGPTGSGKSTLLKLILRYYDVSIGAVSINGINVRDYNEKDLRNVISYVPQKVILFEGSLKENTALGPNVKDEEVIEQSLRFANMGEFIDENKEGINYKVSQGARNLSGGQKQRISIARAVSERLPILILDDPFSALDANTEKKINESLQKEFENTTIIVVTQRLSSVVNYDNIVFLDDGEIVGLGTHKELMKNNKKYKMAFEKAKSPTIDEVS